jgi:peptidoglycan hydrolase-like amidase
LPIVLSPSVRARRPIVFGSVVSVLSLLLSLAAITVQAAPAAAAPVSITLSGHGWGHGRGMGQYGAQGYATMFGWSAAQILDHYYSNTAAGLVPANQGISVRLSAYEGANIAVTSNAPFTVNGYSEPAGFAVFIRADGAGNYLISGASGGCSGAGNLGEVQVAGPVVASSNAGDPGNNLDLMMTVCGGPTYRGFIEFLLSGGIQHTVNFVGVEDYLRGVVPRESPASWSQAALQAQAVAARSYALAEGGEGGTRFGYAKTCDTTQCQVYGGAGLNGSPREVASTDFAVAATASIVRRFGDNSLARTEFSSSTGGWTAGGTFPAVVDDGDAISSNPRHNWQTTLSTASIASHYGVGAFVDLQITQRNGFGDWGGRVLGLSVIGTSRSVSLTGDQFQSDWGLFSNWFTTDASNGPGAVSPSPGRTDVFVRGSDGALWTRTQVGASFGPWTSLGGLLTSDPDASSWGSNHIDVFARGVDGAVWHRATVDGTNWSAWDTLGGSVTSSPTAVSWGTGRIDVFARGGDNGLWGNAFSNGGWSGWYPLGGVLIGDPDVSSWAPGRLDVFVRGLDSALWHIAFTGSGWVPWQGLGGRLSSGTSAVSWGPNRIDVFARGTDNALWSTVWNGSAWLPWYTLGGGVASDPDAAAPGFARLNVVVRGQDGSMWENSFNGSAWSAWFGIGQP